MKKRKHKTQNTMSELVYRALLTETETGINAIELTNDFGIVTWTKPEIGNFIGLVDGGLPSGTFFVPHNNFYLSEPFADDILCRLEGWHGTDGIAVLTENGSGSFVEGYLNNVYVEFRILTP